MQRFSNHTRENSRLYNTLAIFLQWLWRTGCSLWLYLHHMSLVWYVKYYSYNYNLSTKLFFNRNVFLLAETKSVGDSVRQPHKLLAAHEGESVSLDCKYETTASAPSLFWYIKYAEDHPKYVLRKDVIGPGHTDEDFKGRFDALLTSAVRNVSLRIQNVQLSDSAVYYCALRPTVTSGYIVSYNNIEW